MKHKSYHHVLAVVFSYVVLVHTLRIVFNWELVIGGLSIPMWFSWFAAPFAVFLMVTAFRLEEK